MIIELSVENLAIIERCDLALGPGFTVLTGETGAGKSLIVDALELAFGARSEASMVRAGTSRALVSVTLDLTFDPELAQKCAALGAEISDGMLYIQREVFAEGRSQCRIGGRLAPASLLKEVSRLLVDLHGQHDHQSLLDPKSHLGFLDAWIGPSAMLLTDRVGVQLEKWTEFEDKLQALRGGRREREQKLDLLKFQLSEIEAVMPKPGEVTELEARLARLKHAELLTKTISAVREMLIEGESCGRDQVAGAAKLLSEAEKLDPTLSGIREPLDQASILLEEALSQLRAYEEVAEDSPAQLEETAARIDAIKRLFRKYGDDENAVLDFYDGIKREYDLLSVDETSESELESAAAEARKELDAVCLELTELRSEKAKAFAEFVENELKDLAMEKAKFQVAVSPKLPDSLGADSVEFMFSANPGEPVKPLAKIASGGEISRVMLAIKTALMGRAGVPTLIFDEVDAGLGGRAAASVAKKLEELAEHDQVIVITHLPQIAGRANTHYRVEKLEADGRVVANAVPLGQGERVEEVARMIAGEEVGDSALAHARELLSGA